METSMAWKSEFWAKAMNEREKANYMEYLPDPYEDIPLQDLIEIALVLARPFGIGLQVTEHGSRAMKIEVRAETFRECAILGDGAWSFTPKEALIRAICKLAGVRMPEEEDSARGGKDAHN